MKIATWNVNSIKVRAPQVCAWLQASCTDVLAMQEIKTTDDLFPRDAFDAAGYDTYVFGQKTYNGVALAVRRETVAKVEDVVTGIPHYPDEQKRFIAATITGKTVPSCGLRAFMFPTARPWAATNTSISLTGSRH